MKPDLGGGGLAMQGLNPVKLGQEGEDTSKGAPSLSEWLGRSGCQAWMIWTQISLLGGQGSRWVVWLWAPIPGDSLPRPRGGGGTPRSAIEQKAENQGLG